MTALKAFFSSDRGRATIGIAVRALPDLAFLFALGMGSSALEKIHHGYGGALFWLTIALLMLIRHSDRTDDSRERD